MKPYTKSEIEYLNVNCKVKSIDDLYAEFIMKFDSDKTFDDIKLYFDVVNGNKCKAKVKKDTITISTALGALQGTKNGCSKYSIDEFNFLLNNREKYNRKTLTKMFNEKFNKNYSISIIKSFCCDSLPVKHQVVGFNLTEEMISDIKYYISQYDDCRQIYKKLKPKYNIKASFPTFYRRMVSLSLKPLNRREILSNELTDDEKQFIINNVNKYSIMDFHKLFNKTFNKNISQEKMHEYEYSLNVRKHKVRFTKEMDEYIKYLLRQRLSWDDIQNEFNNKFSCYASQGHIFNRAKKLKIKKKYAVFAKGKDDTIGTEYVHPDGSIHIKVTNFYRSRNAKKRINNWMRKQRYIYEKYNGKIPKGYHVIFADGNNRNFDPLNLVAVSTRTSGMMHGRKWSEFKGTLRKVALSCCQMEDCVNNKKSGIKNNV